jgi:nucleoside-diphosphate-sugar epimerase
MNRPPVAVTGATGRIGTPLVDELLRAGRVVRALSRRAQPPRSGIHWIVGDLLDARVVAELVADVDTVFHAGGELRGAPDVIERSLVQGTENVLRAATAARVVHLSSLVVLDTGSAASPFIIDESCPLEPFPGRRGVYTRAKSAAEAMVRSAANSQDAVIVRPGLVVSADDFMIPLSIGLQMSRLVCLIGPRDGALPVVHAEDVATGLLCAADELKRGELLHLVDSMPVTRAALLRRITAGSRAVLAFPTGRAALTLAGLVARSGGRVGDVGYRLRSAGTAHRWSAERAVALNWRPKALAAWFAAAGPSRG